MQGMAHAVKLQSYLRKHVLMNVAYTNYVDKCHSYTLGTSHKLWLKYILGIISQFQQNCECKTFYETFSYIVAKLDIRQEV